MKFSEYIRKFNGLVVEVYVRDLGIVPREDGARLCLLGKMIVHDDFIELMADGQLTLIKTVDILTLDIVGDESVLEGCGECEGCRDSADKVVDYDQALHEWERKNGRLGS